jgi:hypothetical protein
MLKKPNVYWPKTFLRLVKIHDFFVSQILVNPWLNKASKEEVLRPQTNLGIPTTSF